MMNRKTIQNDEIEWIRKEAAVSSFKVLLSHFREGAEENHAKSQAGKPVFRTN
jgi:hypothetical protein